MTPNEEDANAGVVRDKDGNVMSEVTRGWNGNYYGKEKEESDVDVALNLEAESKLGK